MIPIFRAKKIDNDEYVEGFYCNDFIIVDVSIDRDIRVFQINKGYEIDPTTLAIHFPDMLDSQGNKIFASLSEDGKGGDILEDKYGVDYLKFCAKEQVIKVQSKYFDGWNEIQYRNNKNYFDNSKIIGIKE